MEVRRTSPAGTLARANRTLGITAGSCVDCAIFKGMPRAAPARRSQKVTGRKRKETCPGLSCEYRGNFV